MDNQQLLNEIADLQQRIKSLEDLFFKNNFSNLQIFTKDVSFKGNKLGFFSLSPVTQPLSTGETTGASDVTLNNTTTFNGNNGSTAYTVLDVVKHLKNLGLLKK